MNRPLSSASHLLTVSHLSQILPFILLLERLPEDTRQRFLREVCRSFPTVLHPRLAHSARAVSALLEIITKPRGLTLIRGTSELARTFVLTAIAHSFQQIHQYKQTVVGIDIHFPQRLVPVEGVVYFPANIPSESVERAVSSAWPKVERSSAAMLVFNDVWSIAPERRGDISQWARQRHVVLADQLMPKQLIVGRTDVRPLHVLTVSQVRESARIQVTSEGH